MPFAGHCDLTSDLVLLNNPVKSISLILFEGGIPILWYIDITTFYMVYHVNCGTVNPLYNDPVCSKLSLTLK